LLSTRLRCIDVNFRANKAVTQFTVIRDLDDDVEVLGVIYSQICATIDGWGVVCGRRQ
jgi:hypothetical protein